MRERARAGTVPRNMLRRGRRQNQRRGVTNDEGTAKAVLGCAPRLGDEPRRTGFSSRNQPEGEMRFALYVTVAPAWLDPGEAVLGNLTPFWMLYALHDALVKPMPGNPMANSLAEFWSISEDQRVYEFTLRKG